MIGKTYKKSRQVGNRSVVGTLGVDCTATVMDVLNLNSTINHCIRKTILSVEGLSA